MGKTHSLFERSMKVLAVIPARGGSKSIPRKNLADVNGRPLLSFVIEAARSARRLQRVVVSTEDDEIAAAVVQDDLRPR